MNINSLIDIAKNETELEHKVNVSEVQRFVSEVDIQPSATSVPFYLIYWTYLKWRQSKRPDYISYKDLSKYFPTVWKKDRDSNGITWYVSSEAFNVDADELRHAYIYLIRDKISQKRRNTWLKRKRKKRVKNVTQKNTQV